MINPTRSGSGLKNKVLGAFGLGLTVVSSMMGVEALGVRDGERVVLAHEADAFARAVSRLLMDEWRRRALRARANRLLHEESTWEAVARMGSDVLEAGAQAAGGSRERTGTDPRTTPDRGA